MEFALIMPVLLMLVLGIIELAMAFNNQQGLHAAAREGARAGAIPTATQTDISDVVTSALVGVALESAPTITVTPNTATPCASAEAVLVVVSSESTVSIPFWANQTYTLTGRGEFRCET